MRKDDELFEGNGIEEDKARDEREPVHRHAPEFIIIEDDKSWTTSQQSQEEQREKSYTSLQQLNKAHYPFMLRVIALFFSIALAIFSIAVAAATLLLGCANVLTFYKVPALERLSQTSYSLLRKILILTVGFFMAVFSPAFGLALIVIYFLIIGEKINQELLNKIITGKGKDQ